MDLGVKSMPVTSCSASWNSGDVVAGQFPAGLKVLVVDDDPTCLRILEKMLKNCLYEVTTCNRAAVALKFLRDKKDGCDIVMSDVHMPDMDGFKLLEHVGLEMDLPVIMMSADDSKHVVMKGVTHGACDYLIKPVRIEALRNIWQHVVRKKKQEWKEKDLENSGCAEEKPLEDADCLSNSKKRKDEEEERDETCTLKKPRVVWSVDLHQQFVIAVNQLGIDKAVPKRILELMNVPGLTRENVASHLQKFRLYLRRLSGGQNGGLGMDAPFGAMTSLDLQAFGASTEQRNVFNFERPKLRQQQQNNNGKQVNVQSPLMQSRTHHISNSPSSVVFSRIENVGGPHSISRGFVPPNYNNVEDWRSSNFHSTTNIIQGGGGGGGLDVSIEQEKRVGDFCERPLSSNNIFGQEDLMSLLLKQQQVDFDHHDKLTHYS